MPLKPGEVYVHKGVDKPSYALIIEGTKSGFVLYRDTSCRDSSDFVPLQSARTEESFLWDYQIASQEQVIDLINFLRREQERLKESERIIDQKASLLERFAQTLPSCTEPIPQNCCLKDE